MFCCSFSNSWMRGAFILFNKFVEGLIWLLIDIFMFAATGKGFAMVGAC